MTTERDFDRLARAWLELGPDEAPDRVVAAVLQAAETTPQVRRRTGWSIWRSFNMTRLPIVATVVAALVVVIGGGMLLMRSNDRGVGGPTLAPPTPAPSVDATSAAFPETLLGTWVADAGSLTGLDTTDTRLRLVLGPAGDKLWLRTDQAGKTALDSDPVGSTTDELTVATSLADTGCTVGDQGRYRWALSADGVELDLTPIDDTCAHRSATLARTWFRTLEGKTNGGPGVAAGFDPAFRITLPTGAFDGSYSPDSVDIESSALDRVMFAVKDPMGSTDPCTADGGAKKPIDPGIDAFVAYMRTLPGVQVQTTNLTIDGHRAALLTVPVSSTVDCPDGKIKEWTTKDPANTGWWLIRPGDTDIIYVVELPTATYLLQWLGGGVTTTEEQQVLSTVHFLDDLATTP
jgi:hypothetical protein